MLEHPKRISRATPAVQRLVSMLDGSLSMREVLAFWPESTRGQVQELIEELPFTYLHVFPFSPRDDTAAVDLPHPVPQRVSGERARELRDLAHAKGRSYRAIRVGARAHVVVEGTGGTGLTEDYLRVDVIGVAGSTFQHIVTGTLLGDGDHLHIDVAPESPPVQA